MKKKLIKLLVATFLFIEHFAYFLTQEP